MPKRPASIFKKERQTAQGQKWPSAKRARHSESLATESQTEGSPNHDSESTALVLEKSSRPSESSKAKCWSCSSVVDKQAAAAIHAVLAAQKSGRSVSVKSMTLAPATQAKKATFRVTCETLRHLPTIQGVLDRSQLLKTFPRLSASLAYVLCYEVLFGEGLKPHGPAERAILGVTDRLTAAAEDIRREGNAKDLAANGQHPRTARVNTLKMTVKDALGYLQREKDSNGMPRFLDIGADDMLSDVLTFPPATDLHDHPLVQSGALILQSKASCMPAHALAPRQGYSVLDACAAPGNKTTHIAALMQNRGSILALDRDAQRLERLKHNAKQCAANCITARCEDFLKTNPDSGEFKDIEAILLDPSCSGSGTSRSRLIHLLPGTAAGNEAKNNRRIAALSAFQVTALRHALSFPALKRLVYSTCSIHVEENEQVVAAVMEEATARGFELVDPFPQWPRRGLQGVASAEKLIRVNADEDRTDGFFIAVFARNQ